MPKITRRDTIIGGMTLSASLAAPMLAKAAAAGLVSPVGFDVRGAGLTPRRGGPLLGWGAAGPRGKIAANCCHLEIDGEPLAIVAGELQAQRVSPEDWESAILQMKAAGLNAVSSYVFWNMIEPRRGEFDFAGGNDIRSFVNLCAKHGMMVNLRVGPFNNAEFLLGGLPVWLYGLPTTERSNDALYLDLVAGYYNALGSHIDGCLWEQGGSIVQIQLENELSVAPVEWNRPFLYAASVAGHTGPTGAGFTEHYRKLHALAVASGLRAPVYSVTAWQAEDPYPIDVVMPTFGGYMDLRPPEKNNSELTTFALQGQEYNDKVPIGFVEIGYGSPARDSYRPRPPADHGYSSAMTLFGASRSLMVGYYVFRGGSNPVIGDMGWTTKNVMFPLVSYDFWAPISEFGEWRDSVFRARPFNLFVRHYAKELARAEPRQPRKVVVNPNEDAPRAIARIAGDAGFVFVNNFGNARQLSPRTQFSIELSTDSGAVRIPHAQPIDLPAGAMAIWPVNLRLDGDIILQSATAQPVCRFRRNNAEWHVFHQTGSVPVELAFKSDTVGRFRLPPRARVQRAVNGCDVVTVEPGRGAAVEIESKSGARTIILVLSEADAGRLADLGTKDAPLLALSDAIVTRDADALSVASRNPSDLSVLLLGDFELAADGANLPSEGAFRRADLKVARKTVDAAVERIGQNRAVIKLAASAFDDVDDIYLDIAYVGDVCRIFDAWTGRLMSDNMNNGLPWPVGLRKFRRQLAGHGLLIRAEPATAGDNTVQIGGNMTLTPAQRGGGTASLTTITCQPRYVRRLRLGRSHQD